MLTRLKIASYQQVSWDPPAAGGPLPTLKNNISILALKNIYSLG